MVVKNKKNGLYKIGTVITAQHPHQNVNKRIVFCDYLLVGENCIDKRFGFMFILKSVPKY